MVGFLASSIRAILVSARGCLCHNSRFAAAAPHVHEEIARIIVATGEFDEEDQIACAF